MTNAFDLAVTLSLGSTRRAVPALELARLLGLPELPAQLLAVLLGQVPEAVIHSPSTVAGEHERDFLSSETNGNSNLRFRTFSDSGEEELEASRAACELAVLNAAGSSTDAKRLAGYLADRLDDRKSLAFYALVASVVPREVVSAALASAIDLPARDVRRSRAAYFTAIVRPYVNQHRSSTKHAP